MEEGRNRDVIAAVLFAMGGAVDTEALARACGCDKKTAAEAARELLLQYKDADGPLLIREYDGSFQMCTNPKYYENLIRLVSAPKKPVLTEVVMETLSIIAFKNPATKVEIEKIKQNMTIEKETVLHEIHFYEGSYEGRQIVLVTCGVGKVNAGHTAQLLIDKFAVDKVINVGVAGGIQPDVHVGDVVIGVSSTTYDVGPSIMGRYFPFVSNYEYDPEVIEAAKAAK